MKRAVKLITIAILILTAGAAKAADLDLGFRLGIDYLGLPRYAKADNSRGFTAGLFLERQMSAVHAYHLELDYAYREYERYPYDNFWNGGHFVDLAAFVKAFPPGRSAIKPYVYIGPVFSTNMRYHTRGHIDGYPEYDPGTEENRYDFSYATGSGFDFSIKNLNMTMDVRLIRELTSSTTAITGARRDYASVTIGIKFSSRAFPHDTNTANLMVKE